MNKQFFTCIRVAREDLVSSIDNLDEVFVNQLLNIDDETMENMASRIGNILMSGGDYWESCRLLALEYLKDGNSIYEDPETTEYLNSF